MKVLDNSVVSFEVMPGKSEAAATEPPGGNDVAAAAQPQKEAGQQASAAKDTATEKAQEAPDQSKAPTEGATSEAPSYKEQAQTYQSQASESVKGYAASGEQTGQSYVQSGSDAANNAATSYLPLSAQGYARAGVDYATNAATGAVGTVSDEVQNLGEAVGNPGVENVTRLGKTGYNAWGQVGSAVMGNGAEAEAPEVEQDTKEVASKGEEESMNGEPPESQTVSSS